VRKLCDEKGITLIFDEVWTGMGRTGKWFGHQYFQDESGKTVEPDIMTLGKAIGGGLPVGVMFARPQVAELMQPGKHGCTLGGNPICMSVSKTIFDVIERERLLDHARELGEHAMNRLRQDPRISGKIAEMRGRGLFIGIELNQGPQDFLPKALTRGVILNLTASKVIRLAPPINIGRDLWDRGLDATIDTIASL
jgi:acetylornithine/N-succinyldiaminopimelate aminotransferase